jgi:hypothetical protein
MQNLPEHIRESCEAVWGPFEPDPEDETERRLAEELGK